ncbi:phosphatidylinositol 3,4,5-trisphosphate 3-phosphatase cnrN isoform X2 [Drosophila mauritiana]|uniref:Phosphatidylinositol 3,4,5-trisphosphate 3-phosphatase cnrN isoform X2 n=1 Tax=Drosophila mauritiana TaxID=7226 RepID=A0A6P8LD64_DROMA|nr:phosphatidylinositol 3,4,5-trisphosphate 3-phosphatase cnrN isoform X2 [Drosophila mauritiana]
MEPNDEVVERQKLVNDVETEEEAQSAPKSATPASPAVPNIKIKGISSGETTRSRNSASCSIERTISEKEKDKSQGQGQAATKVTYVNERRPRPQAHGGSGGGAGDERFEFKTRPRKLLKDRDELEPTHSSANSLNAITLVSSEWLAPDPTATVNHNTPKNNNNDNTKPNNNNQHSNSNQNTPRSQRRKNPTASMPNASVHSDKFDDRPIKHHSFVSEVPDVKHMERALLGLLDDFHSGKLRAFGSGCTMDQMTKIREQQESLAKLHFELAAAEEDSLEHGNEFNTNKAQENMLQLMQRLEQLSISIEQLQTSHTGL